MRIILGLGNPGVKYNFTRHNTGFLLLDYYLKRQGAAWDKKPQCGAICCRIDDTLLAKPQGYYNNSGAVAKSLLHYYRLEPDSLLVVADDFQLEFGKLRYREKGSAGGNNGIKSIIQALGSEEFPRLRIGTGNDELRRKMGDVDFVLSRFTPEEKTRLPEVLEESYQRLSGL